MKKSKLLFILLFLSALLGQAQTMYIMKNGSAVAQYDASATGLDSVVFYNPNTNNNGVDPKSLGHLKFVLIGDSITHGSNNQKAGYYRKPLWYLLNNSGFDFEYVGTRNDWAYCCFSDYELDAQADWDRDHQAQWGVSADGMAGQIPGFLNNYVADVALIHLGTNNFSPEPVLQSYKDIVAALRAKNPKVTVFIAKIINSNHSGVNGMSAKLRPMLDAWAPTASTADSPIIVVDQYTDFITIETKGTAGAYEDPNAAGDLSDLLHPNWKGANKMAAKWFEAITNHYKINSTKRIFCTHKACTNL